VQVTLKLFATLGDYLPPGSRDNHAVLEVAAEESVADIIGRLGLPPKLVHLVLVNGAYLPPAARGSHRLRPGDQLAIWPPIAGG
jgi:sulfur carrier protein ThiS